MPFSVLEAYGTKSQVRVRGTINGVPYRSSAMPEGDGTHYMVINKGIRDQAGITRGSEVEVVMSLDLEPREVEIPPELNALLTNNATPKRLFINSLTLTKTNTVNGFEKPKKKKQGYGAPIQLSRCFKMGRD